MVLVDTSTMINYLRGYGDKTALALQYILDNNIPFGIILLSVRKYYKVLQQKKTLTRLKRYLETQRLYGLKDKRESYASAAKIYFQCRKKGITINSIIDCLIAQTAIENNLYLLHNDSDFDNIAKVINLKIFNF